MRLYSHRSARRFRQIIADALAILGIVAAFIYAHRVRSAILEYVPIAEGIAASGEDTRNFIEGVADQMRQIPLVGPSLADAFSSSIDLPGQIVVTGEALAEATEQFAFLAWAIVVLVPLLAILSVWVPWRSRFAYKSVVAGNLLKTEAGVEILALRALTDGPVTEVLRTHPRPARAALEDLRVRDALAHLQLREYGHTLPTRVQ